MALTLRLMRVRFLVIVHEAESHAGDGFVMQMTLQHLLCRCADGLAALSRHVGSQLPARSLISATRPLIPFVHPPFVFDLPPGARPPGPPRLLFFGRLLPYKGLDLLAEAIALLPPSAEIIIRVDKSAAAPIPRASTRYGPVAGSSSRTAGCRNWRSVRFWAWADAPILPYREASQSGVAAAAIAVGRLGDRHLGRWFA